ncbi:MAG TPA: capsule assembly Wzi family protein [Gammaproteobacteria bacterium]|nr:capsule assembly Wzi family protein [Gammaproteobacteria bacterium]
MTALRASRPFRPPFRRSLAAWACLLCVAAILCAPCIANADPWLAPGDIGARQDVELLVDSGVIDVPVTTWPLPWGAISAALATVSPEALPPDEQAAYSRLVTAIESVQAGADEFGYEAAAAPGRPALRWFGTTPRGKEEAGVSYAGYNGSVAFRFNLLGVYGASDHQRGRFDGSYIAFALGNWILTAGQIDQYWGPAWSGSLIFGNNSRPVPGVLLSRNVAEPFQTPLLHWLGPWTLSFFTGRLEDDRYIPHPYLIGARFAFRPLSGLEFGITRMAQYGGEGRPQSLSCLFDALFGRTNKNKKTAADDCANELAGVDMRFHVPRTRFDFYMQGSAEDSSGGIPTRWSDLFGLSTWGAIGDDGASYRAFLEYANTTANSFTTPIPNVTYENIRYLSGYRYRQVDLGYPTDNDSELWTAGVTLQGVNGGNVTFLLRHGLLNGDNTNRNEPWGGNKLAPVRTGLNAADVYYMPAFWGRHLSMGVGVSRWAAFGLPAETGFHGQIMWEQNFQ